MRAKNMTNEDFVYISRWADKHRQEVAEAGYDPDKRAYDYEEDEEE